MSSIKKYIAEFIGTAVLVIFGCGTAIFSCIFGNGQTCDLLATAFAFGLSIVAMAYTIGKVSGCHINPAVSLAMLMTKSMSAADFVGYVVAQVLGAIGGAAVLYGIVSLKGLEFSSLAVNGTNGLITDLAGGIAGSLIVEAILTFVFILVILSVANNKKTADNAGLFIGAALFFVHILGIGLTGTSVNPARSIGPAIFAGGSALSNVWVFIAGPVIGAVIAVVVYNLLIKEANEG